MFDDFIMEKNINNILENVKNPNSIKVEKIIEKAKDIQGLTPIETAMLLETTDKKLIKKIYDMARYIKNKIYGKRLVIFAPLYLSNYCLNNCSYCAFRKDNTELERISLTMDQIKTEVRILEQEGHKRLLILCGDHQIKSNLNFIINVIKNIYNIQTKNGGRIDRINVEIAPLTIDEYKMLKLAKIGTYLLFQETYHYETYNKMHINGPKKNYLWRLLAMDRAQQAGIDDIGIGVLFGLYNYKFEVLALLFHVLHLEKKFGIGPHTISIPRLEPAMNAPTSINPPWAVSDNDFKKIVAIIRLAVPYTGIILTTREKPELRKELFNLGVSQVSAGSKTNPGGYVIQSKDKTSITEQFNLADKRKIDDVIYDIIQQGYIPSFCTACYGLSRTGKNFMDLAKPGFIQKFCQINAILSFKEYLVNFATLKTKETGLKLINDIIKNMLITDRQVIFDKIEKIHKGEKDIYI